MRNDVGIEYNVQAGMRNDVGIEYNVLAGMSNDVRIFGRGHFNRSTAKLFNLNFHPLEVVSR